MTSFQRSFVKCETLITLHHRIVRNMSLKDVSVTEFWAIEWMFSSFRL